MKTNNYLLLFTIVLSAACDSHLDIEPVNDVSAQFALKTSADVEALLVGAYDALADGDVYGGNIQRDAELLGDDGEVYWDGTYPAPGEIWSKNMLITNDQARDTWLDCYKAINLCNTVLANIDLVTESSKERVEGEARFIRGVVYFELVRSYAKTWTDGVPAQNPGVPLVLEPTDQSNVFTKVTRNSVAEIYAKVIDDLESAKLLLPTTNGFFATSYSASAILSRVYLMQNNFAAALEASNEVIASGEFELAGSISDAFGRSSTGSADREGNGNATTEDVFAIQVTSQDGINELNTFFASADFGGRGDILIEPAHMDLYEPGDERADLFYDIWTSRFNNQYGNVTIVRLAEMYLTRAECNARLNSAVGDLPANDINVIRNRVGLGDVASVTVESILAERRLELAFEGHLLHDIKRTQRSVGSLPFSDNQLVFPIPQREIIINSDLGQNPGYGPD